MIIETFNGYTILADNSDYPLLFEYNWWGSKTPDGRVYAYARVPRAGKLISMHRLLMNPPDGMVIHHKNNNGLDNRRVNLEITTNRQNIRYAYEHKETGVHFVKKAGKWRAQLRGPHGKFVSLGMHTTREAALEAANKFKAETRI